MSVATGMRRTETIIDSVVEVVRRASTMRVFGDRLDSEMVMNKGLLSWKQRRDAEEVMAIETVLKVVRLEMTVLVSERAWVTDLVAADLWNIGDMVGDWADMMRVRVVVKEGRRGMRKWARVSGGHGDTILWRVRKWIRSIQVYMRRSWIEGHGYRDTAMEGYWAMDRLTWHEARMMEGLGMDKDVILLLLRLIDIVGWKYVRNQFLLAEGGKVYVHFKLGYKDVVQGVYGDGRSHFVTL